MNWIVMLGQLDVISLAIFSAPKEECGELHELQKADALIVLQTHKNTDVVIWSKNQRF